MPGQGLLLVMADVDPEAEGEFNSWYDGEHIPAMLSVPGVLNARRYRVTDGEPKYLAMYDLADVGVLERPEYRSVGSSGPEATSRTREMLSRCRNVVRGVYQHIMTIPEPEPDDLSGARALMLRAMDMGPEHDDEFQDWYNTEHLPILAGVPGVLRARRYKLDAEASSPVGNPATYVALYDLEGKEVQETEDWWKRIDTPWARRIRRFYVSRVRNVYERIYPA